MQEQLKSFQKIEIIESTRQTKPGSTGYIISLSDFGTYNMLSIKALFTKFGKSGKNRFSVCQVKIPLIDINCVQILKGSKEDLERLINSHLMPRKPTGKELDSIIKVVPEESKNLMELDTWNFMAYISAISMFISDYGLHNRTNNDVGINGPTANNIGPLIYRMFRTKNLHSKLKEYVEYFGDNQNREEWLDKLRKEIAIHKQVVTRHLDRISNTYKHNYDFLREIAAENGLRLKKLDI